MIEDLNYPTERYLTHHGKLEIRAVTVTKSDRIEMYRKKKKTKIPRSF